MGRDDEEVGGQSGERRVIGVRRVGEGAEGREREREGGRMVGGHDWEQGGVRREAGQREAKV